MSHMPAQTDGRLRVAAPTYEAACLLEQRLDGCHTQLIQDGSESWAVTAQPWRRDGRALTAALTAIERWLCEVGLGCTSVRVGEHDFTLTAEKTPETAGSLAPAAAATA